MGKTEHSMSLRPAAPSPKSSRSDDLESTAELPVLDPAGTPAADRDADHRDTDTWVPPLAGRAAPAAPADTERLRELERDLQSVSASLQSTTEQLHDTEQLLVAKDERLRQVERARDEALATLAAAEQRAGGFEQRLTALAAELAQRHAAAVQHVTQLNESAHARVAAEQRAAAVADELAQVRAQAGTAQERARLLEQRITERETDERTQRAREQEQQQALAAQGRAHAAGMMEDLHHERARAMSYLESLQTLEGRRRIVEELATDLHREADARAEELARLARELAGRDSRAHELNAELTQRAARIARLEQQVSTITATLAQRDTHLRDARQQAEGLQVSIARLQAEATASAERVRTLETTSEQHKGSNQQQLAELQRLRDERAELDATLEAARVAAAAATQRATAQEAALTQQRERATQLETQLTSERQRAAQLEGELTTLRSEMDAWGSVVQSAQGHLTSIATAEARVRTLEHDAAERHTASRALELERDALAKRVGELEEHLHAAEDTVHRLEADARGRAARVDELEKSNQQWRATAEEARHAASDTVLNPALRDAARHLAEEAPAPELVPEGATRLLIQGDGEGPEVVHVLGRKTSIGRTPDNDLQLDAKFVSRHHAVILAGPLQTIIEDLNSTNGVQVNGRRVTRHTLKDGDQIAIGRAHYRFALRRAGDKR
jgi:chromosome segregation ATPase